MCPSRKQSSALSAVLQNQPPNPSALQREQYPLCGAVPAMKECKGMGFLMLKMQSWFLCDTKVENNHSCSLQHGSTCKLINGPFPDSSKTPNQFFPFLCMCRSKQTTQGSHNHPSWCLKFRYVWKVGIGEAGLVPILGVDSDNPGSILVPVCPR